MKFSGVFKAKKKDGTEYFRASLTYKEKHISLGSFKDEEAAGAAYAFARDYLDGKAEYLPEEYDTVGRRVSFEKWIMLLNLKKTGMYCKNPVYLFGRYFVYYLDRHTVLKFGADDFFFFRNHKLQKRGGHIFYSDYGMQCGLLNRFGIKNYAVEGIDYYFKNGDSLDFRFGNLIIINKFNGVFLNDVQGRKKYNVRIHLKGNLKVGSYTDEIEAAVAYNKAADRLEEAIRRKIFNSPDKRTTIVENKMLGFTYKNSAIYRECQDIYRDTIVYKRRMFAEHIFPQNRDKKRGERCVDIIKIKFFIKKNTDGSSALKTANSEENTDKIKVFRYRRWRRNYIEGLSKKQYIEIYERLDFSKSFKRFLMKM